MADKNCPVCTRRYYSVDKCGKVCTDHQHWLVVTCEECGRMSFSDCMGICMACGCDGTQPRVYQGRPDHRYPLRKYGQAGSDDVDG